MSGTVRLERRTDGAATLWLDNPGARNAMDDTMIEAVIGHMAALGADRSCRAVVLRGQGGVFCSGYARCVTPARRPSRRPTGSCNG